MISSRIRGSLLCCVFILMCGMAVPATEFPGQIEAAKIFLVMEAVADWQMKQPEEPQMLDWLHGALYAGFTEWAKMSPDGKYLAEMKRIGEKNGWNTGPNKYDADDYVVGRMFLELYCIYRDPVMIKPLREHLDYILKHPAATDLKKAFKDRWNWCDALFMGPPVWAKMAQITGDEKYLDFMDKEFAYTTENLYDTNEHLYYRDYRYLPKRTSNGQKVFWSRGNGWVMGGLVQVLKELPQDYPQRQTYLAIYKQMAAKVASLQQEDGLWRPSLLDADNYPFKESSGSGFFCYAIAWGINQGILDRATYLTVVKKAWAGLVGCVGSDGKVGYVQPVGSDPKAVSAEQTATYGVGAFLLAGTEVYKLSLMASKPLLTIVVTNPTNSFRSSETVVQDIKLIKARIMTNDANFSVFSDSDEQFVKCQAIDNDGDGKLDELLFQTDLCPNQTKTFWVFEGNNPYREKINEPQTFAMFVPQRKDDFAWENDRIAYRMYGPSLQNTPGAISGSGVDVWVKSVRKPVIAQWYKLDSYHMDHGEGLDFYEIGTSLGCGGIGFIKNDALYVSKNFAKSKNIANGPIRSIFELTYEPWDVGGVMVQETKRISIDLGSNMTKFESTFTSESGKIESMPAAGIVRVRNNGQFASDVNERWMVYWPPADPNRGSIGCAVIIVSPTKVAFREMSDHGLLTVNLSQDGKFIYYAGACWDRGLDFKNKAAWTAYVKEVAMRLKKPVITKLSAE